MRKKSLVIGFLLLLPLQFIIPAAAQGQATVLSSSGYLNSVGLYHVVGEVQNTGSTAITAVMITATFYTSNNTLLGTRSSQTMITILESGRKAPFDITVIDFTQSARTDHYALAVTYEQSANLPLFLDIVSSSKSVDAAGFLHISGKIRNGGSGIAHETRVVATLYDSGGKVVDAAMSYCDPTDIAVGTRLASFEIITLEKSRVTLVDSYTLYVQSIEYSTVEYGVVPEFAAAFLLLPTIVLLALIMTRRRSIPV